MVALLVHRCCRERVAAVIEEYCRAPQHDAHAHWYTTSTSTCSAFDLAAHGRCLHGTLHGADLVIVDALLPDAKAHCLQVNELRAFLLFGPSAAAGLEAE